MKLLTIQITIRDENRYASDTNIGLEDINHISIIDSGEPTEPKVTTTTIKNDGTFERSKEHQYSKQELLDRIIQNIRYLQRYPDMK